MTAFAIACLVLKVKRPDLPRLTVTSVPSVLTALALVLVGLAGTIIKSPAVVAIFFAYFLATLAVVMVMFERTRLLRLSLYAVQSCCSRGEKERAGRLRAAHVRNEEAKLRSHHKETAVGLAVAWQAGQAGGAAASMPSFEVPAGGAAKGGGGVDAASPLLAPSAAKAAPGDADLATPLLLSSSERGAAGGGSAVNASDAEYGTAAAAAGGEEGGGGSFDDEDEDEGLPPASCRAALLRSIKARVRAVNAVSTVFFAKDADLTVLNKAVLCEGGRARARLISPPRCDSRPSTASAPPQTCATTSSATASASSTSSTTARRWHRSRHGSQQATPSCCSLKRAAPRRRRPPGDCRRRPPLLSSRTSRSRCARGWGAEWGCGVGGRQQLPLKERSDDPVPHPRCFCSCSSASSRPCR